MIDWIQVRRERRFKTIAVQQQDIEDYILIGKLPDVLTISTFDLPEHWTVSGVTHSFRTRSFLFGILSPEFDPVPDGVEAETIPATRHALTLTIGAAVSE